MQTLKCGGVTKTISSVTTSARRMPSAFGMQGSRQGANDLGDDHARAVGCVEQEAWGWEMKEFIKITLLQLVIMGFIFVGCPLLILFLVEALR